MRFKSFGFCENSSKSGEMMRLCWVVLFSTGVLGFEESPVFLEWLVELSAEKVSGENKKDKMTAQKSSGRRAQRGLLNNLSGFFTFLGSTVRPRHFHVKNLEPEDPALSRHKGNGSRLKAQGTRKKAQRIKHISIRIPKSQILSIRFQGFRCQVSGVRKKNRESSSQ